MAERFNIDDVIENSEFKPINKAVSNALYGFSHGKQLPVLQSNKDSQGMVFFTRPQLNFSTNNLRNVGDMYPLLTNNPLSIERMVRVTLDPRLQYELNHVLYDKEVLECPLVDKFNPFIPILTNTLTNLSGWPDSVIPTHTTKAGLRKEQLAMIDGTYEINDVFSLSATFRNFINEPITLMIEKWIQYGSLVFEGMLYPYIDMILENEFDYNTRIYKFTMDSTNKYIKKSFVTGASFPKTWPSGKYADFAIDKPYNEQVGEININFECMGAMYNYDRNLLDFNKLVATFNPDIRKMLNGEDHSMVKIDHDLLKLFDFRGYPVINLETYELMWFIDKNSPSYKKLIENPDDTLEKAKEKQKDSEDITEEEFENAFKAFDELKEK